ncbi:MAG TPA: hypothetical protein VHI13_07085 [Candidatus Kapabacteria bacterium]|nr:hypothetical protein [Candidatus Kapabacteria bacterium]
MIRYRWYCCCVLVLLAAAVTKGAAQHCEVLLGAGGGYETGTLRFNDAIPPLEPPGSSRTAWPEGHLLLIVPRLAGNLPGCQVYLGWPRAKGTVVNYLPESAVLLPGSSVPVTQRVSLEHTFDIQTLQTALLATFQLPSGFSIGAGPTLSAQLVMNDRMKENLIEPQDVRFQNPNAFPSENNGRTLILSDGEVPDRSHITIGMMASLLYTLHIGTRLAVIPEVHARHEFTDLSPSLSWTGLILGGGLNVAWVLGSEPGR